MLPFEVPIRYKGYYQYLLKKSEFFGEKIKDRLKKDDRTEKYFIRKYIGLGYYDRVNRQLNGYANISKYLIDGWIKYLMDMEELEDE